MLDNRHSEHNVRPDLGSLKACLPVLLIAGTLSMQGALAADREEMMITAQKRGEQALQEVPIAVQAIGSDQIRNAAALEFSDMAPWISSLVVQDLGPGDRKYIIRGVNSTATSAVGVYYDESPITARTKQDGGGRQAAIELHDIERIEVLKGPQGTLYGASSSAGTIRYIPNRPDASAVDFNVGGQLSSTEDGGENYNINGMVNVPVAADVFALRAVGWYTKDDGFVDNLLLGTTDINDNEVSGAKLAAEWIVNENWTLSAFGIFQNREVGGTSRQMPILQNNLDVNRMMFTAELAAAGFGEPSAQKRTTQSYTVTPWDEDLTLFGGKLEWDVGPGSLLVALNYFEREIDFNFDSTPILLNFAVPVPAITFQPQKREVTNAELRWASDLDGPVQFVVGGFVSREDKDFETQVIASGSDGQPLGPFMPGDANAIFGRVKTDELDQEAIFGEAEWFINDQLSILGGLRWYQFDIESVNTETQSFVPSTGISPDFQVDDDKVTGKVNLTYRFTDDALVYGTISQGFRPGGTNDVSFIEVGQPIPPPGFGPDELTNYELGWKTSLMENRIDFNGAVFYIDWEDLQTSTFDPGSPFEVVRNVGEAEITGVEFDISATPVDGFYLSLTGSLQNAEFASDVPAGAGDPPFALDGQSIPNVPDYQFGAIAEYSWQAFGDTEAMVRGDWSYQDDRSILPNDPVNDIMLDSFHLFGLRLGLEADNWTVALFVRNLFDEDEAAFDGINSAQDPRGIITARPRTIGIQLQYRMGEQ
jgi:outer membrane receptor protein involved in Fe transport